MDPAMCECVWLMTVVMCVCGLPNLGEEDVCGCAWVWVCVGVWGGGLEGIVLCFL